MVPSEQESKLPNLDTVELLSIASSRLEKHQHEPTIQKIKAALVDHSYEEALRLIEKLLSDTDPAFIGKRAGEERDWKIAPGVKMTFCWCPPGNFLMGSPTRKWYSFLLPQSCSKIEENRCYNENQVSVTLSTGFWIAKTQVTQSQWQSVMGKNPSKFKGYDLPVVRVKWNDIQEFINKVNQSGEIPFGREIRLPTEAQWEYACRAGEKGPYSGGTLDQVAWYDENSLGKIRPVGTKKPNAWGLHDMLGNVWERCSDWYDHALSGGVDPSGPSSGSFDYRVVRGGSWSSAAGNCRAARRIGSDCSFLRNDYTGFRLTIVPSE
jgi:formylglycine-generating enzyme required for sulfatase activity